MDESFSPDYDLIFKILLVGSSNVGKSSILSRLCNNTCPETFIPTVGVDFKIKSFEIDETPIKLQIWDTAGQERFKTITSSYYKGAHGVMLVFDISCRDSFDEIEKWNEEVFRHAGDNIIKILIGNKSDLTDNREVSTENAKELAALYKMQYIETSAKNSKNVEKSFKEMACMLRGKILEDKGLTVEKLVSMRKEKTMIKRMKTQKLSEKKGCC